MQPRIGNQPFIRVITGKRYGSVVQLVRMPPCHGGGRGFESRPVRKKRKVKTLNNFKTPIRYRTGGGFVILYLSIILGNSRYLFYSLFYGFI